MPLILLEHSTKVQHFGSKVQTNYTSVIGMMNIDNKIGMSIFNGPMNSYLHDLNSNFFAF